MPDRPDQIATHHTAADDAQGIACSLSMAGLGIYILTHWAFLLHLIILMCLVVLMITEGVSTIDLS